MGKYIYIIGQRTNYILMDCTTLVSTKGDIKKIVHLNPSIQWNKNYSDRSWSNETMTSFSIRYCTSLYLIRL